MPSLLVPLALLAFLILYLKNDLLVACSVPLLLVLGESIFIRTWDQAFRIPLIPFAWNWRDVVFAATIAAWLYLVGKRASPRPLRWGWDLSVVLILSIVIAFQIPLSWIKDGALKLGVILAVRTYLYLPLSIYLWFDMLRRLTREEADRLLNAFAWVTVPLSILYAVSSSGIAQIYTDSTYYNVTFGSGVIIRDALSFPIYSNLALAYFLTKLRKSVVDGGAICAICAGVFFSYTRSWLFPAVLLFVFAILYMFMRRRGGQAIVQATLSAVVIMGAIPLASSLLPDQTSYLTDRLLEVVVSGTQAGNLATRVDVFQSVNDYLSHSDPVWGAGFAVATSQDVASFSARFVYDNFWSAALLLFGWAGVIAFVSLFAILLLEVTRTAWTNRNSERGRLSFILFLLIFWYVLRTMSSSDILTIYPGGAAFFCAIIIVEAHRLWQEQPVTLPGIPFLRDISFDGFTRNDEYALLRRLSLALLVSVLAIYVGRSMVR